MNRCPPEPTPTPGHDDAWLDAVAWNDHGLAPAIVQSRASRRVLTLAWMNRAALAATLQTGLATYWSRSRARLWQKGETSGHHQRLCGLYLDCDRDALLLEVEQIGGAACHTGRVSCFYRRYERGDWVIAEPVRVDPNRMYGHA